MNREELWAKHGQPERIEDIVPGQVLAFKHDSYEAAQAYVDWNDEECGHPCTLAEMEDGWMSVVDLRPAIAEIERSFKDG